MKNIDTSAIEEQFKKDCTVIELKYEYPNYTGTERFAIVSELSQATIETKYTEQLRELTPYIFLDIGFLSVRKDFIQNEDKARKRMAEKHDAFGYDDEMELYHNELAEQDFSIDYINDCYLKGLLKKLPEQQFRRIYQYYLYGYSIVEIAEKEGVSHQSISKSIKAGLKYLKKICDRGCI